MSDDFTGGNLQGSNHRLRSVSHIFIGPTLRFPGTERKQRLRAIQRLNPWLFVHTQYQRILRRIQVQAHDIQ